MINSASAQFMRNFAKAALPKIYDPSAEGSKGTKASIPDRPASPNLITAVWPGYESDVLEDIAINELLDDEDDEDVEPRMKRQ